MRKIHRHPIFVAVVLFSKNALFTIERKSEPYEGFLSLPEGPVAKGERLEDAALRVLKEASGLVGIKMKLIGIYDDVQSGERRIQNQRSYIISYVAAQWTGEIPLENCRWLSDWKGTQLAFEHNEMVMEAEQVIQMANKSRYLYALR